MNINEFSLLLIPIHTFCFNAVRSSIQILNIEFANLCIYFFPPWDFPCDCTFLTGFGPSARVSVPQVEFLLYMVSEWCFGLTARISVPQREFLAWMPVCFGPLGARQRAADGGLPLYIPDFDDQFGPLLYFLPMTSC